MGLVNALALARFLVQPLSPGTLGDGTSHTSTLFEAEVVREIAMFELALPSIISVIGAIVCRDNFLLKKEVFMHLFFFCGGLCSLTMLRSTASRVHRINGVNFILQVLARC